MHVHHNLHKDQDFLIQLIIHEYFNILHKDVASEKLGLGKNYLSSSPDNEEGGLGVLPEIFLANWLPKSKQ